MADDVVYVVDTSSWLFIEGHPEGNRILDAIGRLVSKGRVVSPPEVFDEFKRIEEISGWLKTNRPDILENCNNEVAYLLLVGKVTAEFPAMSGARSRKNKADPYVVALAKHKSANPTKCIVVADETLQRRPSRKLPTACAAFGLECRKLIEVLQHEFPDEGW